MNLSCWEERKKQIKEKKRKENAASSGMKADCQPQISVCIERNNSSI